MRSFKGWTRQQYWRLSTTRLKSGYLHWKSEKGAKVLTVPNKILKEALTLKPEQKAELVDKLLSSLDQPDSEIDELWAKEAESRIDAYEQGRIKAVTLER